MQNVAYKLEFLQDVHFGIDRLEKSQPIFQADRLFSALFQEALKVSDETAQQLLEDVYNDQLRFSDALPYQDNCYFIPKPILSLELSEDIHALGNSKMKKRMKKLQFLPFEDLSNFLSGMYEPMSFKLGQHHLRNAVAIRGQEEASPYRIDTFRFNEKSGLYVIIQFQTEAIRMRVEELLESLSYSGIGGRRSSGLGRFSLKFAHLSQNYHDALQNLSEKSMTLCAALPKDEELEHALEGATFSLEKRSGFIASDTYSETLQRKQDLYVLSAGSCFVNRFQGDVYDVGQTSFGSHPVYRYLKPMWLGVN